jgi:hypothetical protein
MDRRRLSSCEPMAIAGACPASSGRESPKHLGCSGVFPDPNTLGRNLSRPTAGHRARGRASVHVAPQSSDAFLVLVLNTQSDQMLNEDPVGRGVRPVAALASEREA